MPTTTIAPTQSANFATFEGGTPTTLTATVSPGTGPSSVHFSCSGAVAKSASYPVADGAPVVIRGLYWGATVTLTNDGSVDIHIESAQ
jgi:hypothetical protein